jgi:hypothetical protein
MLPAKPRTLSSELANVFKLTGAIGLSTAIVRIIVVDRWKV